MGDRGSYVYTDNRNRSIEYTAQILLDIIPKIYNSERIIKTLSIDGVTEDIPINKRSVDDFNQPIIDLQTGEQVIVNDLSKGKYVSDVTTSAPYATLREESAQQLIELASSSPLFEQSAMDLIAKNLPILESEELTKRIRHQMIQSGAIQPTPEEIEELGINEEQPPAPEQVALIENANADTAKKNAEAGAVEIKNSATLMKSIVDMIDGLEQLKQLDIDNPAIHDLIVKQQDIIDELQDSFSEGANSEQQAELAQMVRF
jgi:hypothetical protein